MNNPRPTIALKVASGKPSPEVLAQLNPGTQEPRYVPGQKLRVPNVGADRIAPDVVNDKKWEETLRSLALFRLVIDSVEPRTRTMLERVRSDFSVATDLADGLVVHPEVIRREVDKYLPYMATENILMAAVAVNAGSGLRRSAVAGAVARTVIVARGRTNCRRTIT